MSNNVPMMTGTDGQPSYLAFAKNGKYALGIKPAVAAPGDQLGVPDTMWFGARLRCAEAGSLFDALGLTESNIVSLKKPPENPGEAWGKITWDKIDHTRASTTVGILLHGSVKSPEGMKMLISQIDNKTLATKMVDYLEQIAGKSTVVISREVMIDWFDDVYKGYITGLKTIINHQTAMTEELNSKVGMFAIQADILKAVYNKTQAENEAKIVLSDNTNAAE